MIQGWKSTISIYILKTNLGLYYKSDIENKKFYYGKIPFRQQVCN